MDLLRDSPGLWVCFSFLCFAATNYIFGKLVPVRSREQGRVTTWKWTNIANSLLHSVVTGAGALYGFYLEPKMAIDVVSTYNTFSHVLLSLSTGYFFYDFMDMLLNHRKRSSYELMVHHTFVILCFSLAVFTKYYIGYGLVSLLVEVNSTFLHWRQLLLLQGKPKSDSFYRKVSLVNLTSFVVFRVVPLGWMTRWLAMHGHTLPVVVYALGCVTMLCILVMSIILFFRLISADFYSSGKGEKLHAK